MGSNDRPDYRIRGVEISFSVLDAMLEHGRVGISQLARELGHSKSTIYDHVKTLEDLELVVEERGGYRVSLRVLGMAEQVRDHLGNYETIRSEVDSIASKTGEVSQFGIEEHGRVSYLYKATGDQAVETASRIGGQQPIYSTALGKTILAFLPAEEAGEIIDSLTYTHETASIANDEELYSELETIREQGYGIDYEENVEGLRCVAAPVRQDRSVIGAISLSGPSRRFTDERIDTELAETVQRAANVIELNAKFS